MSDLAVAVRPAAVHLVSHIVQTGISCNRTTVHSDLGFCRSLINPSDQFKRDKYCIEQFTHAECIGVYILCNLNAGLSSF
jgi:hypothetical protein